uniref:GP-PDE domain-containing protein n=1 Tax=Angiostrongylus cantonensis TaxID=6313 RepID=A0A0K0CV86_ANGCA
WESFLHPRLVVLKGENKGSVFRANHVDLFGYYAGRKVVSEGWLQYDEENQILLRLHGFALKFYKSAKERKNCTIKINPMDVRHHLIKCIYHLLFLQVLSDRNPKFTRQPEVGVLFNNNVDYIVYKTHSVAVEFLAFYIEIFSEEGKRIGACYALPSSLSDSCGHSNLPFINSSGRPIGQISVEYLFVRNLRRSIPKQTMEVSYTRHWKKRNTIEVGHRGAGNSFTKFAVARENTIYSLNTAAKNGADYVEFDVQLTKDKVAVIYHDFHVLVSVAKLLRPSNLHNEKNVDFHEIPVKDLKLHQLKLLMVSLFVMESVSESIENVKKLVEDDDETEDFKPFPTLVEALAKVDPDVGFNVEVKYPMMQSNGEHECDHYFERNEFIDVVLADLLNNAGTRRIMFSSFDPDICSLISMKQNKYPVLFLCVGETQRYTRFQDQRSSTSLTAVNFAAGADIMGVNFNSEDLLNDPYPVKRANDFGLITFVWGEDLDKKENINYFKKELGVDGLIYDRCVEISKFRCSRCGALSLKSLSISESARMSVAETCL